MPDKLDPIAEEILQTINVQDEQRRETFRAHIAGAKKVSVGYTAVVTIDGRPHTVHQDVAAYIAKLESAKAQKEGET